MYDARKGCGQYLITGSRFQYVQRSLRLCQGQLALIHILLGYHPILKKCPGTPQLGVGEGHLCLGGENLGMEAGRRDARYHRAICHITRRQKRPQDSARHGRCQGDVAKTFHSAHYPYIP